jgi:hypothetical protein
MGGGGEAQVIFGYYGIKKAPLSLGIRDNNIMDIIHRSVFYLELNCTDLSVPNRKHITSALRAQQVNRFETMA